MSLIEDIIGNIKVVTDKELMKRAVNNLMTNNKNEVIVLSDCRTIVQGMNVFRLSE